ncbi:MAG TPA: hypothetical protein EYP14_14715 [Planctomycetaceae bacterium]|nr:hypothetical protein [Planctomycetaceae bacterium]
MTLDAPEWLRRGQGLAPRLSWSFRTDASLAFLCAARETGEVLAGDVSGGIYRLDRRGQILSLTRGVRQLRTGAWADTGDGGLIVLGDCQLTRLNQAMEVQWSMRLPDTILGVATDPYGDYTAISLAGGSTLVVNRFKKRVALFETIRPLRYLEFLTLCADLVAAAEHSHLCRHRLTGTEVWNRRILSTTGDMAVSGDGSVILLAAMNLGIQAYDQDGESRASYVLEGTAKRVAASLTADRIVVATLEQHLYWLDSDGQLLWATHTDESVAELQCDPFGEWILVGMESGRIFRLDW